ncbi:MAG TPA: ABC transporter permease [Acidimicrobiales bacterium]|nr:ABC transporter permease [Acidimicrobiales bacterium]
MFSATQRGSSTTRRPSVIRTLQYLMPPLVAFAVLLVAWQALAAHNPQAIPPLGAIWRALVDEPGRFVSNSLWTIDEMAVGLVTSALVAFWLAVFMTHVRVVERALMPLAVVLNVTPVVSFAPGLLLLFGFSMMPRYIVTAIIVFFPFLVNSFVGLRSVDPDVLDFFLTLNASKPEILWRLRLPSSLPYLFAAARIGVPLSLVGAVVAEFTTSGNSRGLGATIEIAYQQFGDLPVVYASVVCLAVIGVLSSSVVIFGERRLLRWSRPERPH